jgi:hypothetical protein
LAMREGLGVPIPIDAKNPIEKVDEVDGGN